MNMHSYPSLYPPKMIAEAELEAREAALFERADRIRDPGLYDNLIDQLWAVLKERMDLMNAVRDVFDYPEYEYHARRISHLSDALSTVTYYHADEMGFRAQRVAS